MSRPNGVIPNRQALLQEAANWLVLMDAGDLSPADEQALQYWYQTSPDHERVWQAACELQRNFSRVPTGLAKPVLNRQRISRRTVLKSLAGAVLLLPLSLSLTRNKPWQPLLADYRSGTGEQKSITLADGSELILNTDTALDVQFDSNQRLIHLYEGEVFIRTGKDVTRPFSVLTEQGSIQALGTEFAVRCLPHSTLVTVTQDAVRISPRSSTLSPKIEQGKECLFTPHAIESIKTAQTDSLAWRRGELIVNNWRLDTFLQELARYHPGILRCDNNVASLKVSGVFQTKTPIQGLEVLAQVLDLHISKYSNYWISLGTAAS